MKTSYTTPIFKMGSVAFSLSNLWCLGLTWLFQRVHSALESWSNPQSCSQTLAYQWEAGTLICQPRSAEKIDIPYNLIMFTTDTKWTVSCTGIYEPLSLSLCYLYMSQRICMSRDLSSIKVLDKDITVTLWLKDRKKLVNKGTLHYP